MNKFVVWDKKNKRFLDGDEFAIDDNGKVYNWDSDSYLKPFKQNMELLNYIGKNDINNNKIYADCSIVEFGFIGFGESKIVTYQGFAKWNSDKYRYDIEVISHSDRFVFDLGKCIDRISNLKIIDTMQENKLGLINKKG